MDKPLYGSLFQLNPGKLLRYKCLAFLAGRGDYINIITRTQSARHPICTTSHKMTEFEENDSINQTETTIMSDAAESDSVIRNSSFYEEGGRGRAIGNMTVTRANVLVLYKKLSTAITEVKNVLEEVSKNSADLVDLDAKLWQSDRYDWARYHWHEWKAFGHDTNNIKITNEVMTSRFLRELHKDLEGIIGDIKYSGGVDGRLFCYGKEPDLPGEDGERVVYQGPVGDAGVLKDIEKVIHAERLCEEIIRGWKDEAEEDGKDGAEEDAGV